MLSSPLCAPVSSPACTCHDSKLACARPGISPHCLPMPAFERTKKPWPPTLKAIPIHDPECRDQALLISLSLSATTMPPRAAACRKDPYSEGRLATAGFHRGARGRLCGIALAAEREGGLSGSLGRRGSLSGRDCDIVRRAAYYVPSCPSAAAREGFSR